jgi:hypothetical protein
MILTPALQKILKIILHREEADKHKYEEKNVTRQADKQMRKDKGKMKHYKPISFRNCRIPFKNN